MEEETHMLREVEYQGEQIIDNHEEFHDTLINSPVGNETLDSIRDKLLDSLDTIKTSQMTIDITRKNKESQLKTEIEDVHLQDLDLVRYAKSYLEHTKQIEILNFREITKLKQALVDVFTVYEEYEESTKTEMLTKKIKRNKTLNQNYKIAKNTKQNKRKAEIIVAYEEAKKLKEQDKIQKMIVLKTEFKHLFKKEDEARQVFKKITGDTL